MPFVKRILDFSKPGFLELHYIDIVIEEKTLFLVSWKSKRHHKVKIFPLNKTYHSHETAVVLKVPRDKRELTITLYSFWRKRRYRVLLKKIKLDKETAQLLITKFKPVKMLRLKTPAVNTVRTFCDTNLPVIVLKKRNFSLNTSSIIINTNKLTYTIKTSCYE